MQNKGGVSDNSLSSPNGIAADAAGNVYIADSSNNRVLEFNTPLRVTAVPGSGDTTADLVFGQSGLFNQFSCNGPDAGSLCNPIGVGLDPAGHLFIGDFNDNRVLEYTPPFGAKPAADRVFGQFGDFTLTGCNIGVDSGSGPQPSSSTLCGPAGVALDPSGDAFVADRSNNRVLAFKTPFGVDPVATLVLGQADYFDTVANAVDDSGLNFPASMAVDLGSKPNHLYVADSNNNRVLAYLDAATFVNGAAPDLVIGQPDFYSGNCNQTGPISERTLCDPQGLAVDSAGNLFVADRNNSRVLEYLAPFTSGYAANEPAFAVFGQNGDFSKNSCNGTTGIPSASTLCNPSGLFVDSKGKLYVADSPNNRVLEFDPPFAASPVANHVLGQADFVSGGSNRGSSVAANTLSNPASVVADKAGDLYVSDSNNNRALEYNAGISNGPAAKQVFGQGGSFTSAFCNSTRPIAYAIRLVCGSTAQAISTSLIRGIAGYWNTLTRWLTEPPPNVYLASKIILPPLTVILAGLARAHSPCASRGSRHWIAPAICTLLIHQITAYWNMMRQHPL